MAKTVSFAEQAVMGLICLISCMLAIATIRETPGKTAMKQMAFTQCGRSAFGASRPIENHQTVETHVLEELQ